jgi:Flp pilus assembly protein TadD
MTPEMQRAMVQGLEFHKAGRLAEAEAIYRQVLAADPNNADALNLLGTLTLQCGQAETAVVLIRRAIALRPNTPNYFNSLGVALDHLGQLDAAIQAYQSGIALDPNATDSINNLGNVMMKQHRLTEAVSCFETCVRLRPNAAETHFHLGNALKAQERFDAAIVEYRTALRLRPDYPDAHNNLGNTLKAQNRFPEAIAEYQAALRLKPTDPELYSNLGEVLRIAGQTEKAVIALETALRLRPNLAEARCNLGNALYDLGRYAQAKTVYQSALALRPNLTLIHCDYSFALMILGEFQEGWPQYEWRRRAAIELKQAILEPRQPLWDGRELGRRRLLLHAEQGFGDTIQFIRYVSLVAHRGGRIAVACQRDLIPLLRRMPDVEMWAPLDSPPDCDVHCPLLSLPGLFKTNLSSIPAAVPYLSADPARSALWKDRLPTGKLKVGLAWAGTPGHRNDHNRSIKLQHLAPLAQADGMQFISLQKGPAAAQTRNPPMEIADWSSEFKDFADTAALVENLDLVIAVDTAVAHLAGAMGKPVWAMLPFSPDWRWMVNRSDSPWYPTMRLFRQPAPGDWTTVVGQVTSALRSFRGT